MRHIGSQSFSRQRHRIPFQVIKTTTYSHVNRSRNQRGLQLHTYRKFETSNFRSAKPPPAERQTLGFYFSSFAPIKIRLLWLIYIYILTRNPCKKIVVVIYRVFGIHLYLARFVSDWCRLIGFGSESDGFRAQER